MNEFEEIYKTNAWGFGSGHGSLPAATRGYREFIQNFLHDNGITTVVDYGCGDWQFSRYIDWAGIEYLGLEVVETLVKANSVRYGKPNIKFAQSPVNPKELPAADLLLVKDVLQHLSREQIDAFIQRALPKYRFSLITNNFIPENMQNRDIKTGQFRPLDLRKPPYSLNAVAVYAFGRNRRTFSLRQGTFFDPWHEVVLLIKHEK